jgi:hypothetical protein
VLIGIQHERTQPLAGTAAAKEAQSRRFGGWLELLRVIAELVAAAPVDGEETDAAEEPCIEARRRMPAGCIPAGLRPFPGPPRHSLQA